MRTRFEIIGVLVLLTFLGGIITAPIGPSIKRDPPSQVMQTSRTIAVALFGYANDNEGRYPEGRSSTEVFQQLMDGKYISDAKIFYVKQPGKVRSEGGPLKPENVSYDVTCCGDAATPGDLPLVFLTGYVIDYVPGARATPRASNAGVWARWWNGVDELKGCLPVAYFNHTARVLRADESGAFPDFIPIDFNAKGRIYRQLTP